MSDYIAETPRLSRYYCSTCEPECDPTREIVELRFCSDHAPSTQGADDDLSAVKGQDLWLGEGGYGETNRAMCEMIHGRRSCDD